MARSTAVIRSDAAALADRFSSALASLAGESVLITGAGGFLCSYLVDVFVAYNDHHPDSQLRIVALDNFITGLPDRLAHLTDRADVAIVAHDIAQPYASETPAWLVHGASIASPTFYRRFPMETIDANVNGTRHMLDLGRHSRAMLVMSTSEIYGDPAPDAIPTSEQYRGNVSCTGPRACYDESKRMAETLCWVAHQQFQTPVMTIRPFNVFGPGQRLDDRRLMPDLFRSALADEPAVLHSDGRATRAMCYVTDAIAAMLQVLTAGVSGEPYNIGNDEGEKSVREIADLVARAAGAPEPVFAPSEDAAYLTDNPQRRCPDLAKLRSLSWTPEVSVTAGIDRTLTSYREELITCA
jgi:dTDP-glucose 4,6-dehydratase/UDP-glucuronate decarboxylase